MCIHIHTYMFSRFCTLHNERLTFRLMLRALRADLPPHLRLRGLLKLALRAFRFRCVAVEEVKAAENTAIEVKA